MLHRSETCLRKENEVALQQAEIRMVRWICGNKLQDRVPSKGMRERLELDGIISVLQQRGRPRKTWRSWKKTVRHVIEQEGCHGL